MSACQVGKAPPVLTMIREEMGMSLFLAGWIISIFNVIGLAVGPFAARRPIGWAGSGWL